MDWLFPRHGLPPPVDDDDENEYELGIKNASVLLQARLRQAQQHIGDDNGYRNRK